MGKLALRVGCCSLLFYGLLAAQTLSQGLPTTTTAPSNSIPAGTKVYRSPER